jgi:hypothetical protein
MSTKAGLGLKVGMLAREAESSARDTLNEGKVSLFERN